MFRRVRYWFQPYQGGFASNYDGFRCYDSFRFYLRLRIVTRRSSPTSYGSPTPHETLPVFFGHIYLEFASIRSFLPKSQSLEYCGHIYGPRAIKLSPGSSQLSPNEIQLISDRLGYVDDAAIFSASSFPSWFTIIIPSLKYVQSAYLASVGLVFCPSRYISVFYKYNESNALVSQRVHHK